MYILVPSLGWGNVNVDGMSCLCHLYTSLSNMLIHGYQVYIRWREWNCLRPQSWRQSMGQMYGSNVHLNLHILSPKKESLYPGASDHSERRQKNRWDWMGVELMCVKIFIYYWVKWGWGLLKTLFKSQQNNFPYAPFLSIIPFFHFFLYTPIPTSFQWVIVRPSYLTFNLSLSFF